MLPAQGHWAFGMQRKPLSHSAEMGKIRGGALLCEQTECLALRIVWHSKRIAGAGSVMSITVMCPSSENIYDGVLVCDVRLQGGQDLPG